MSDSQQIPEKAEQAIKQLSQQHDTDRDDMEADYIDLLEEERDKGVSDPGKRALRRLSLSYKGSQMQEAESLKGFVLGVSDAINTSLSAINRARDYIKKQGVEKAVKQGLVKKAPSGSLPSELASVTVTQKGDDDQEESVDYAVLDTNDNSPTSGEVLPAEDYIRYVHGAVWRSSDDGPHWFTGVMNAEDEGDKPVVPTKNEPVAFEAVWVGESDQNNTVRLRFRDSNPFRALGDFGGPDVTELLESDDFLGHTSLENVTADRFGRNDMVATYGSVTYMELSPDEDQSRRLTIVDPFAFGSDLSRTVWLPDHVEVDFAEESDVYVIGQVSPSQNEYPDSIEALGVYVHPDYQVDRSNIDSMADGEDEPESGESETEPETKGAGDGGPSAAAEAGKDLKPPEEVEVESEHDAEFDTAADRMDDEDEGDEEQEAEDDGDDEGGLPPVVEDANYPELQSVASDTDNVPGSGIGEDEMRGRLAGELGPEELARELISRAGDGDDEGESDTQAADDDGDDGGTDESQEESVTDGGDSDEPSGEDEDWEW